MSQHTATELAPSIIDSDERQILQASSLLPLALTLAFSAKESVYKAFSDCVTLPGFDSAKLPRLPPRTSRYICCQPLPPRWLNVPSIQNGFNVTIALLL